MHPFLIFAAAAASPASPHPVPANAAACEVATSRQALLNSALGKSELLTRLANAGLAQDRAIADATNRSRSTDRVAAGRALRLLADPKLSAGQASLDARIDRLFDAMVAALRSPDETQRCRTVVSTLGALAALEAESEARARSIAQMLDNPARLADAR